MRNGGIQLHYDPADGDCSDGHEYDEYDEYDDERSASAQATAGDAQVGGSRSAGTRRHNHLSDRDDEECSARAGHENPRRTGPYPHPDRHAHDAATPSTEDDDV